MKSEEESHAKAQSSQRKFRKSMLRQQGELDALLRFLCGLCAFA
jgi:hypothetical protein